MKRIFILTALSVLLGVASASAQQIAVVTEGGETTVFQTLQATIEGASPGSVIYLPGGGFSISDDVKITKKLTIIGIGHKSNNDNEDGSTIITGNLWFNGGSSGSAVLGCYITGEVYIGDDGASVNGVMVRCCNLNSVQVKNNLCQETIVNQNYIRGSSLFSQSNSKVFNNVSGAIIDINGGLITNNIINGRHEEGSAYTCVYARSIRAYNSNITKNIILPNYGNSYNFKYSKIEGSDNTIDHNMSQTDVGDSPINIGEVSWDDVFVDYNNGAISPMSNFHFKEVYKQYESQVGVYANGVDFDNQTAPVPYIVAKRIAEETDAAGQLKIQVRVKAGE